jgi:predicted ATPase
MPSVVFTGGPGAGKTTLLRELARRGYRTVEESARAIIAERLARGASPRPDRVAFAREILRRDIEKCERESHRAEWVFFDRGVPEALAMLEECAPLPITELRRLLSTYTFHSIFVLPPWEEIYCGDTERDQTFEEAMAVHGRVVLWYRACGYTLHEVPALPVQQRATHVLTVLGRAAG